MPVPTRFIEGAEYAAAIAAEDGVTVIYTLSAIPFAPPGEDGDPIDYNNYNIVRILRLNVDEPRIYKDPLGPVYVVLPKYHVLDYAYAQDIHPLEGMWCYRYGPYVWMGTDPESKLDEVQYLFNDNEKLARFETSNPLTH